MRIVQRQQIMGSFAIIVLITFFCFSFRSRWISEGCAVREVTPTSSASEPATPKTENATIPQNVPEKVVVMGRLESEDTDWVAKRLPDWEHVIYTVNNQFATLHTPRNKGKEATPYLTYIIEHYDRLPSTIVFLHSHEAGYPAAWHTDNQNHDNAESVRNLNLDFVQRNGYANLRCLHVPGCPDEIQPFRDPPEGHRTTEHAFPVTWRELFQNNEVPSVVATACYGQFAVSRDQVLRRPLSDYQRYLKWLLETPLDDEVSDGFSNICGMSSSAKTLYIALRWNSATWTSIAGISHADSRVPVWNIPQRFPLDWSLFWQSLAFQNLAA